jgi:DNA invertase Pin-like site-specific DNA recombinase
MKTGIYVRCSTNRQDVENQLISLKEYCQKAGFEIYKVYSDYESGDSKNRAGFNEMMMDASQKKFEMLVFWSLDRLSREGVRQTLHYLEQLENHGVNFKSFTEQYIDSTSIFRDVIISLLATLAKQEKIRIKERVIAGLRKAKIEGRVGGRPKVHSEIIERILELKKRGFSNRRIGRELQISNTSVGNYLKSSKK